MGEGSGPVPAMALAWSAAYFPRLLPSWATVSEQQAQPQSLQRGCRAGFRRGRWQRGVVEQRVAHLHLPSLWRWCWSGPGWERPSWGAPSLAPTGARPGHSYTVKSPSSFSSSEEMDSSSLGGSLCLNEGRIAGSSPRPPGTEVGTQHTPGGQAGHRGCICMCSCRWVGQLLTAPGTASAASGAGNGTSPRYAPASGPQAVET